MTIERLAEIIGQAIGHGSLCWDPKPTGVFDSVEAKKALDDAVSKIVNEMNK